MENNVNLGNLKFLTEKYTPEFFEQLERDSYKDDREYPENFSNWFPHISDFGWFKCANVVANQIFTLDDSKLMRKTDYKDNVDWEKLNEILAPTKQLMKPYRLYNIKNGCFSNKFHFDTCIASREELAEKLWDINYASCMFDTGGYTELVVREIIPNSYENELPTIYHGMPLREEIRVFYNMATQEIEYMVDYWDYEYCRPHISNISDQIVFDWFHNKISGRKDNHKKLLKNYMNLIEKNINTLKFDGCLNGIWSIDFLCNGNDIYLIDMARGFRSAYWNPNKVGAINEK